MRTRRTGLRKRVGAVAALAVAALTTAGASQATAEQATARPAPATIAPAQAAPATTAPAKAAPGASTSAPVSWTVALGHGGSSAVNVRYAAGALQVRSAGFSPAGERPDQGYGSQVYPAHAVGHPVNRVRVALTATTPASTRVTVDVRGRDGSGAWTEWRAVNAAGSAVLPRVVDAVQARVDLWSHAAAVRVRGLRLTADTTPVAAAAGAVRPAAAESYQVYATREGLVGGTTANGHVIQTNDHFVALPSDRALSPNGSSAYSVTVCGPARCETAPVWDVGPWNTTDDYWNPAGTRQSWTGLAQGMPEAEAAYQSGYNGGQDQFGRSVSNPAGIDLADGTFYNVGLNDNGWVTVTYNWTSGGGAGTKNFPTWGTGVNIHGQANSTSGVVAVLAGPTTVAVQCQVHGQSITYDGITNDGWSYLPAYGGYISNIFINVPQAWLPGVPTC
ncbi:hypothetical protein [Streptantibioticus silvisoli]|uniref:Secreted protein n=1 Tax=Streptantibioticus silvisoli TaxID=2705255 RepID=A0ABT6W5S5_9ACTN|nr:hypothetical protein [Streptantibioticus silvisoli]MDI5964866.1 hypothetical protein [Streptantibioticus silvisoli]